MADPKDPVNALSPLKRALLALDDMKARLDNAERSRNEPIAIVGLGCRFPGGSHGPEAFWQLLRNGRSAVTEVPRDRWDCEQYYDPDPAVPGKSYGRWGAFLDGLDRFDPQFFGIAPREAAGIDPQQRLLLETTWEALEDAGTSPERLAGVTAGVFVGINSIDYATLQLLNADLGSIDAYSLSGSAHSIAAGRLAYVLGLQGPAMAVDTACSSSLVAVHLACQSLRNDECRVAVAGGVHITLTPINSVVFSRLRMLAADGQCKTFDARGDGFVEGEGCAVIVLKRLSDALAEGDRILALVRGSAVNQDGASSGLTAPNGPAQETVIRAALKRAGVKPAEVGYVEAHGTGTSLGDPIEVQALAAVLGAGRPADRPLAIGSVKTNVGHTQAAAGIAGLVKLVLALQHREIPANLHFDKPNPFIPWADIPVTVADTLRPWPAGDTPRVGGVSSFGFSGTNVHVVVGEAPDREIVRSAIDRPLHPVTLSARSEAALARLAARWHEHLRSHAALDLRDVAFTANVGRAHLSERVVMTAAGIDELRDQLAAVAAGQSAPRTLRMRLAGGDSPRIAFLFTGQGAQYAGMGRELYDTQPTFRAAIDRCDEILRSELEQPLVSVLYPADGEASPIDCTAYTQPALFAVEYALAELWRSWGIVPSAVMGHSIGEYVAAVTAGVFSMEDALKLVAARGRLMQSLPPGGVMAAVFASEATVKTALAAQAGTISIAAVNGPEDVVISGAADDVAPVLERLKTQGVTSERLTVSHAFHSSLMDPILDQFEQAAAAVTFSPPRITIVSNLTGQPIRGEIASPGYWRRHLRQAVRFADGVTALHGLGYRLFLEIGPRPTLSGLARKSVPAETPESAGSAVFLPSLRKAGADWIRVLETIGELYGRGAAIDWSGFDRDYARHKVALPTYAFERERHWLPGLDAASRPSRSHRRPAPQKGAHALLGTRLGSALKDVQFESEVSVESPAFLADHVKQGTALFPATAFVETALAAAHAALGGDGHVLQDLVISEPLRLDAEPVTLQTILSTDEHGVTTFQLFSRGVESADPAEPWRLHATGTLSAEQPESRAIDTVDALKARCTDALPAADYYQRLLTDGHEYGPAFQGVKEIWKGEWEAMAAIELPEPLRESAGAYGIHPALLDAAMQILAAAMPAALQSAGGGTYIPISLGRCRVHARGARAGWSHVRAQQPEPGAEGFTADVRVYDEDGRLVAEVEDIYSRRTSVDAGGSRTTTASWLYDVNWEAKPRGAAPTEFNTDDRGCWILLALPQDHIADALAERLRGLDRPVVRVAPGTAYSSADGHITVDPADPSHFTRMLSEVESTHGAPRDVVHLWSATRPLDLHAALDTLNDAVTRSCAGLLHLVQAIVGSAAARPRLTVVTVGGRASVDDGALVAVEQAPVLALARTVATEHPDLSCITIDLDPAAPDKDLEDLSRELLFPEPGEQVAFRRGERYVARLVKSSVSAALAAPDAAAGRPRVLEIAERGVLDRLELRAAERRAPGPGEIEIRVLAAGLNFRDVLNALGMYEGQPPFGAECVGTVVSTGPDVTAFKTGDVVLGSVHDTFRSYVTGPAGAFIRKPDALGVEEAATIPVTFLTADYALNRLGRMSAGSRVLIHAAAGGVGLAAVQLAQRAGAEIFATAGSPEKHAYLRSLGITHIFSSRDTAFAEQVLAATGGAGVDLVLNSLNGAFIEKSLSALGRGGRFLEIGKAGIWTADQMKTARPDVEYHPIYFSPDLTMLQEMLGDLMRAFETRELRPLPHRSFSINQASEAFRFMAQAKHIGKVLLTFDTQAADGAAKAIRGDATYLITGGLGSLGLHVATWLVGAGARHLVLAGRRPPLESARETVERLEAAGARVEVKNMDVAREEDVRHVLADIQRRLPPLRGIVHAAGVLDDGTLVDQSWPRFEKVFAPKLAGAWLLHRHTEGLELDFFVMFSSMASLFGPPAQGNYAAANAFLDALAERRRAAGLPALSIAWGPWADSGMTSAVGERDRQRWRDQGFGMIPTSDGVTLLERLLALRGPARLAVLPIDWSSFLRQFPEGQEPPFLRAQALAPKRPRVPRSDVRSLMRELEGVAPARRRTVVAAFLRDAAVKVLGLTASADVDPQQPLRELGLDSLMAVELRNTIAAAVQRSLPATLLFRYPTLNGLTDFVMTDLYGAQAAPAATKDAATAEWAAVGQLSDEEAGRLLAEELESLSATEWTKRP